jgi:hypothetical protein
MDKRLGESQALGVTQGKLAGTSPGMYVVSESGTIEPLKKVDTLKAMLLVPGGLIIIPSRC